MKPEWFKKNKIGSMMFGCGEERQCWILKDRLDELKRSVRFGDNFGENVGCHKSRGGCGVYRGFIKLLTLVDHHAFSVLSTNFCVVFNRWTNYCI